MSSDMEARHSPFCLQTKPPCRSLNMPPQHICVMSDQDERVTGIAPFCMHVPTCTVSETMALLVEEPRALVLKDEWGNFSFAGKQATQ